MQETPSIQPRSAKINIKDLSFYYGDSQALRNISLEIPERRVTALIGPSGCGKSTLIRVLNRIYELYPDHVVTGRVMIDGQNILDGQHDVYQLRTRVGMVFQRPTPFPMSIFDNVAFGVRLYERLARADLAGRVEWALRKAALWDEIKDKLGRSGQQLSGGQQQRLCIARALAVRPEILLLDEPASALDPISTAKIEELIAELKGDYTIVMVTHNMQQAGRVSDLTAFMYMGELVECGLTEDVFTKPRRKLTEEYITGHFG